MRRAVAHLAAKAGIRKFLDIGTGLPTSPNVHEMAQTLPPGRGSSMRTTASDIHAEMVAEGTRRYHAAADTAQTRRDFAQVARFLDGLEIIEPGIVQCHRWHPDAG